MVNWLALTNSLPQERELLVAAPGTIADQRFNPSAETILPLLGERAGVREVVAFSPNSL
jgi:hypothetical protein